MTPSEDGEVEVVRYRLLATVRLGGSGRDFVRVYDSDIREARPMSTRVLDLPHDDDHWQLVQPGSRYMLYYIRYDSEPPSRLQPKEVTPCSWSQNGRMAREEHKGMRGWDKSGGWDLLPYGAITVED